MFLLDNLLMAPGNGMLFLFKELARKAQEEWLDDDSLKQELQEMYALFEAGKISERDFEERECRIVERLQQIAKAKYQQKWGADTGVGDAGTVESLVSEFVPDLPAEAEIAVETSVRPLIDTLEPALPPLPAPPPFPPLPVAPPPPMEAAAPSLPPTRTELPAVELQAMQLPVMQLPAMQLPSMPPPPMQAVAPVIHPSVDVASVRATGTPLTLNQAIDSALRGLSLLNLKVSSVTAVTRAEDGWSVTAELVERRGVPDTSDLLGLYELRLDEAGNVLRWERTRMRRRCDLSR